MNGRQYATPIAFRQALDERLRTAGGTGALARERQLLVFERFLARVAAVLGDRVMVKGGLVLELRLEHARTTKDVDLRVVGSSAEAVANLQAAGRLDLGDFLSFDVLRDPEHPDITNPGMRYDGVRHRVEAKLGGKRYGEPFGVDVGFADPVIGVVEEMELKGTLAFAGVAPGRVRLYPIETHVAEKLHAYTLPRDRPNSRVKDLPDLALLASIRDLDGALLRKAIETTFTFRRTHDLPLALPSPPPAWVPVYARLARENALPWSELHELTQAVAAFLDPLLAGRVATWSRAAWSWALP